MMRKEKGTRGQEDRETRGQGDKWIHSLSAYSLSTRLLVYLSGKEPREQAETAYDRIPATNRRFRL